jgi:hypothetical protein
MPKEHDLKIQVEPRVILKQDDDTLEDPLDRDPELPDDVKFRLLYHICPWALSYSYLSRNKEWIFKLF